MMHGVFNVGNPDFSHVSGLSYIAVRHPRGLGVDIIQSDTGQTVQTIVINGVTEVSWSANSCHLAILVHVKNNHIEESGLLSQIADKKHVHSSSRVDTSSKLKNSVTDSALNSEKFEVRLYAFSECSTSATREWSLWKTVSAPLYSSDLKNKFGYSHISFSFPLLTLSVISCSTQENNRDKIKSSSKLLFSDSNWLLQRSKVVLLDVNVGVFDEVILFLPDSEIDPMVTLGR